jgi:hypothetical protein
MENYIKLTNEQSEEVFLNALCDGLGQIGGFGLSLYYNKVDYKNAQQKLNNPTFEDVLMQILRDGNSIQFIDEEEGGMDSTITLDKVHERVPETPEEHLMKVLDEQYDANDADIVLQTVAYGEIIF